MPLGGTKSFLTHRPTLSPQPGHGRPWLARWSRHESARELGQVFPSISRNALRGRRNGSVIDDLPDFDHYPVS
jgi:hypothetical protein